MERTHLHIADYVVLAGIFAFTMVIGIRYAVTGQRSTTREKYFVADRKMHFIPVAISLLVTFQSSIMMLGLPAEVYIYGASVIIFAFSHLVTYLTAAVVAVPLLKPLNVTSVYEYLQKRFKSRNIRLLSVLLGILQNLFYMSIVLYALAVAFEAMMGINVWVSILVMDVCAVLYTSLGGIKSVVWTDVFQAVVMFSNIFAVIIKGTIEVGGTHKVWEYARAGNRLHVLNFDPDPTIRHSVWTMFLPVVIATFGYNFNQSTVQRISASKSMKGARGMILVAAPFVFFLYSLVVYEGIVIYAFFSQREVEPLSSGLIQSPNQILPYAVLILFENYPGMTGLFMAALYCASLSTISSCLSSMSILVTEDLFQPLLKQTSDARATLYAKISVVVLGAASVLFCLLVMLVEGPLHQVAASLFSASGGPSVGLFCLACFFPSTHKLGAVFGIIAGFVISSTLTIGGNLSSNIRKSKWLPLGNGTSGGAFISNLTSVVIDNISNSTSAPAGYTTPSNSGEDYNTFFSLSYCLYTPFGVLTTIIVGIISSYIFGRNRPGNVNPKYLLEISDSLLVCLPPSVRKFLKGMGPQFMAGWKKTSSVSTIEQDQQQNSRELV